MLYFKVIVENETGENAQYRLHLLKVKKLIVSNQNQQQPNAEKNNDFFEENEPRSFIKFQTEMTHIWKT